jgi:XTP/dITP diphosphohydrolase
MPVNRLLIATSNRGKMQELRAVLGDIDLALVTPEEIGLLLAVVEDGRSYRENAEKKAVAFARASGLPALADDSGLEVDALGGDPGLHSARYLAEPGATDADRRAFLLRNLRDKPRPWKAHFRAAVAISSPDGTTGSTEGECSGWIIPEERGTNGFGYDPIFLVDGMDKTMAELESQDKNRLSHRGKAVVKARPILLQLIRESSASV